MSNKAPIKAVIIDDEPLAHEIILKYVEDLPTIRIVEQFYSSTDALQALSQLEVDLLFLDINMPLLTGVELLKVLHNKPQVIFTTAYEEYALQGYELNVTDYLLKPFTLARFLQAVEKVNCTLLNSEANSQESDDISSAQLGYQDSIFIKVDKKHMQLSLADIQLFEAYGNYVKVWKEDKCYLTPKTLSSFEGMLPNSHFVRVHKSAIVNMQKIHFFENEKLILVNDREIAIGKSYKKNLNKMTLNTNNKR